jgi:hypothetical protein
MILWAPLLVVMIGEGRATIRLFFEIDGLTWIGLDWIGLYYIILYYIILYYIILYYIILYYIIILIVIRPYLSIDIRY